MVKTVFKDIHFVFFCFYFPWWSGSKMSMYTHARKITVWNGEWWILNSTYSVFYLRSFGSPNDSKSKMMTVDSVGIRLPGLNVRGRAHLRGKHRSNWRKFKWWDDFLRCWKSATNHKQLSDDASYSQLNWWKIEVVYLQNCDNVEIFGIRRQKWKTSQNDQHHKTAQKINTQNSAWSYNLFLCLRDFRGLISWVKESSG